MTNEELKKQELEKLKKQLPDYASRWFERLNKYQDA